MTLRIALYGVFFLPMHAVILTRKTQPASILPVTAQKNERLHHRSVCTSHLSGFIVASLP